MLTPERIKEIRERLMDCAPGPWKVCEGKDLFDNWPVGYFVTGNDHNGEKWAVSTDGIPASQMTSGGPKEDAEFIAHARRDVPELLNHITELQAKVDVLQLETERLQAIERATLAYVDASRESANRPLIEGPVFEEADDRIASTWKTLCELIGV